MLQRFECAALNGRVYFKEKAMARKCYLSDKRPRVVNSVSRYGPKEKRKCVKRTKRRQLPNLQTVRVYDETTGVYRRRRVSVRMIRTLDKKGLLARAPKPVVNTEAEEEQS